MRYWQIILKGVETIHINVIDHQHVGAVIMYSLQCFEKYWDL